MLFIQSLMPHTVPGVPVFIALILHLHVVGVDDGRGEVNQGVQFVFVATLVTPTMRLYLPLVGARLRGVTAL